MMTRRPLPDYTVALKDASLQIRALLDAPHSSDEIHQARVERAEAIWNQAAAEFANDIGTALAALTYARIKE